MSSSMSHPLIHRPCPALQPHHVLQPHPAPQPHPALRPHPHPALQPHLKFVGFGSKLSSLSNFLIPSQNFQWTRTLSSSIFYPIAPLIASATSIQRHRNIGWLPHTAARTHFEIKNLCCLSQGQLTH
jgi:hypothetical protein